MVSTFSEAPPAHTILSPPSLDGAIEWSVLARALLRSMIPRLRHTDTKGVFSGSHKSTAALPELARRTTAAEMTGAAAHRADRTRIGDPGTRPIGETRWNRSLEVTRCGRGAGRLSDLLTRSDAGSSNIHNGKRKNSPIRTTGWRRPSINLCVDYSTVSHFDNTQDPQRR